MSNFKTFIVAALSAFFIVSTPIMAAECPVETQEARLTEGLQQNPELLYKILEGESLIRFFTNLTNAGLMVGMLDVDKIYFIKSENHEGALYMFYLKNGCITDVKMTVQAAVDKFL